jgi:MYXO-CTERM domain-containing protein
MIATRTRTWWQHFSAAGVLFALASCSSEAIPPAQPFDDEEPGALAGELTVYIANYDDGTADTRYFLKVAEGDERRLHFSVDPDVAPGTRVKIWGTQREDKLAVTKYKVAQEIATEGIGTQQQRAELIDAAVKPGRALCAALVNVGTGTAKTTLAAVKNSFHTGTGSVNAYYRENSFGQVGLDGDTYGPFTYAMSTCDYQGMAKAIKPMISATCQQYAFVFGPNQSSCGWSGLGQVGTSDKPASDTWYNDSVSCVVAVQEPGHNYGMQHSSSITCGGAAFADDPSSCTHSEYGDKYDTMGGGCYHMNAWQKLYQKWFGGCNAVRTTSSGKFNLYPLEAPCNGVQVLQLPFPGGKSRTFQSTTLTSYYLELRTASGFDSKYGAASVLIHAGGAPILPNTTNPKGLHVWALAAGGTTWGLAAGKSFSDPAGGLTITVDSVSATGAVVDINYAAGSGSPVCLDGASTPFAPPGPADCTAPISDAAPPIPPPMDARTDTGTGGTGGAGSDAAGGTAGIGAAGSGGTAGMAGMAGMAGKAGSGGSGGSGGSTGGTGGATGGSGGDTGTGATGGTGGTDTGGSGGDSGRGGAGGRAPNPEPLSSGCGCKVASSDSAAGARSGGLALLGLAGLFGARRRKRS